MSLKDTLEEKLLKELLKEQYEEALSLLVPGQTLPRPTPAPLSHEARMARKPLPPEVLAGAMQDRVHKEMGNVRVPGVVKDRKLSFTESEMIAEKLDYTNKLLEAILDMLKGEFIK